MKRTLLLLALAPLVAAAQSGHEAGYQWAANHGIEHPDECTGNSNSFIEGCEEYAQELQRDRIQSGQCEDEDYDEICDY
ncbi:hypothetical protein FHR47_002265 [Xanthomonas arboricola]|uniref:hypothetical protein n=1 Tax=Xanthomonas cannabis TaxID=1885674 RepID=UPI00160C8431|nr:hypothetical protein [Xanthomonas cannabis]MBB3802017.1 hypothetical protein [Xanthomonas cannabis]